MAIIMTSKTKISLIAVMAVAGMLMIPTHSIVNAVEPIELSDEMNQMISKMSPERQHHMKKILLLAEQKKLAESESEKQALDKLIEEEHIKLGKTEEKNRKVYNDHPQLRSIQQDINNLEDIPLVTTIVGKNKLTILLAPGNENKGYEEIIDQYVPNKDLNVVIEYGEIKSGKWSCDSRESECDPLHGGIAIRKGGSGTTYCTLGLPVKQGTTSGYLTAGHCYSVNDDVYQPYDHWLWNWQIGDVQSGDSHNDNDCDCAFITDSNSRTNESKVWFTSSYSRTISGTQLPTDGEELDISGNTGGWYWEDVYDNNYYHSSIGTRILIEDTMTGGPGDSGGPVIDLSDGHIVGIIEGPYTIGSTDYIKVVPWSLIADSTNGVGVTLY